MENTVLILTRAVCGTAEKKIQLPSSIELDEGIRASKVLGVFCSPFSLTHPLEANLSGENPIVQVQGEFVINTWYVLEGDKDTGVAYSTIKVDEKVEMEKLSQINSEEVDARIRNLQNPTCINYQLEQPGLIKAETELAFYIELIGETMMQVEGLPVNSQ